jgi:protein-S-isoprenylcysteine O-methyltransferase Ste14
MNNLYLRAFRAVFGSAVVFLALIFIPAGTFNYWQGWVFAATSMVLLTLTMAWIAVHDKELLERRLPSAEKTRAQQIFTVFGVPVGVASILVMVFDHRFGWSPAVPAWLSLFGDALCALGILVYFLVIRKNRFAAATVEVVPGQVVVSTGPYAIVRHPMYAGAIVYLIGAPLALGSWWGLLFAPVFIGGFVWRSLNEEEFLRANLQGYTKYCREVRYRLVPYIW